MVGTDLEGLISAHNQTCLAVISVLEKSHIASTTLLPLVGLADKLEELGTHLEGLLLDLLAGLDIDFLGETNDRLEVHILRLWFLLLKKLYELIIRSAG